MEAPFGVLFLKEVDHMPMHRKRKIIRIFPAGV